MQGSRPNGSPADPADQPIPRGRQVPGFVDQLGDRTLSVDPATGTLVETLRLRRELSDAPHFESALRDRVARLLRVKHPAFATVQAVVRDDAALQVVSAYASGRRLSELTPIDNGFALAVDVIRRITPAIAALQDAGAGTGHGALSLNRLVMTRDKRLIVVEHVLAPALESLHWSRPRFNDLDLIVPDTVPVRLDERNDMRQLAWIVLSLLVGRSLPAREYAHARELFDEARSLHTPLKSTALGEWLQRALQFAPDSFANARDAAAAFDAFAHDGMLQAAESAGALLAFHSETGDGSAEPVPEPNPPKPAAVPIDRSPKLHAVSPSPAAPVASTPPAETSASPIKRLNIKSATLWVACALGAVVMMEAIAIVVLMLRPPVVVPKPQTSAQGPPPLPQIVMQAAAPPLPSPAARAPKPAPSPIAAPSTPIATTPNASPRLGGFTLSSPIELQVFKNGALVGSTAGPVAIGEGRHTLEFVNQVLGFRVTQVVDVVGGQLTSVRVAIPTGHVSINAVPWAEVTIDGVAAGTTPLGNLALPIGVHEILFRHPDLGERKQTVVVRADVPTRVTETFK